MIKDEINASEYVVFDVETNGLSSKKDDLLSISFYKPDDDKRYTRFLPLEKNSFIKTTNINGITIDNLSNATPITQNEFDLLAEDFDLRNRTILTYSGNKFDQRFLNEYLKMHGIKGYENFKYYNIKSRIISSRFSHGNVSKDNLCKVFKIDNVSEIHSGENDCILEWELFKAIGSSYLLVTNGNNGNDNVFRMTKEYIIPVSLFRSHPNLSKLITNLPNLRCESELVYSVEMSNENIKKFGSNIDGVMIEHLINTQLSVKEIDSNSFLLENKKKLEYLGKIPSAIPTLPIVLNYDGTATAVKKEDKAMVEEINDSIRQIKAQISQMIDYIKNSIFKGEIIYSQELMVNKEDNVLALCDLSTSSTILEIKTNGEPPDSYKLQLYYEAAGRDIFYLNMEWKRDYSNEELDKIVFRIYKVKLEKIKKPEIHLITKELKSTIAPFDLELIEYPHKGEKARIKCLKCGNEWTISVRNIEKGNVKCKNCNANKKKIMTAEMAQGKANIHETAVERANRYSDRIYEKSHGQIVATGFTNSKKDVNAKCLYCGYEWTIRADHLLLDRCRCPKCK